jgi:hypothetical protein
MKWVTRERARVDRIACPWLIARFIDKEPAFLFVPADQVKKVADREGAIPCDIPGVELGHHGERCSFDAFIDKYELEDSALHALFVRALRALGAARTGAYFARRRSSVPSPRSPRSESRSPPAWPRLAR